MYMVRWQEGRVFNSYCALNSAWHAESGLLSCQGSCPFAFFIGTALCSNNIFTMTS
eukprot:m.103028 g.103028  ORF g.103028 m.103028 type:complete len:56 (+) comp12605_c1_seq4:3118-3285(+)